MSRLSWTLVVATGLAGSLGCGKVSGPVQVEALVRDPDASEGHRLATVTLTQVEDLFTGEGELFDFRSAMATSYVSAALAPTDERGEQLPPDELAEVLRGTGGGPVNPRLSFDPIEERWLADDFNSLVYLTALHNFEEAWRFYRDVVGDDTGATQHHGYVGLSATLVVADWLPLDIPFMVPPFDNAAYNPMTDSFILVPHLYAEGVPLAAAQGVIAHEFGHRVFQHNVLNAHGSPWLNMTTDQDLLVLLGLNEGAADVFTVAMMQDPDFLRPSVAAGPNTHQGMHRLADQRQFGGPLAEVMTWQSLLAGEHPDDCGDPLIEGDLDEDELATYVFNFYCVGTLSAQVMWEAAGRDTRVLRDELAPSFRRGLFLLRERQVTLDEEGEAPLFTVASYLDAIASALPDAYRPAWCDAATVRFAPVVDATSVPACF